MDLIFVTPVQELLPGACDYYDRLMTVRPDDLVITICFSRYTAQIAEGAAFLHAHDVPIVLMTDLEPSPPYAAVRGLGRGVFSLLCRVPVHSVRAMQHARLHARDGRRRARAGVGARASRPRRVPVMPGECFPGEHFDLRL